MQQCVRDVALRKVHITCHNVDSIIDFYQLRCALAKVTILGGAVTYN